ncbi:hypothetical protein KXD40_009066 [Peronospora effusa]|uniref:Uncharacterized protein n=1 Tax=Peronospora effusa TaxID=542832 RepID=A0A3M6VJC2_9STRA|nr:hypothetical protein DD238_003802 [Peronospora effusa]UIZ25245.1 hypothetical protein KXD40_009066 [Peronospora effusa]CAI5713223.1 unnamed protein product [Peronospora effusa]
MTEEGPRIDEHFDRIRANLIRCEECNENFFFDFLRHPRYFVTHFKTCHLKKVLYRFNGCSEEENQRVRFGPRRKKDAISWFSQLKSTEKRMISMQDNKWGEIVERECWSCRLYGQCKHGRKTSEMPHAFEPNELGRRQALLHLRQFHETAYNGFLCMLPAVGRSSSCQFQEIPTNIRPTIAMEQVSGSGVDVISNMIVQNENHGTLSFVSTLKQSADADRSRLRRMRATPEAKKAEAERSRRRREQLTPAQRQADVERRVRKRHRIEEQDRSRVRRAKLNPDAREREVIRSRERRQNATEQQRNREAQRSRMRRQNATEEQRLRERERCRRRYETQKLQKQVAEKAGALSDVETQQSTIGTLAADTTATSPDRSDQKTPLPRTRVMPRDLERRNRLLLQQQAGLGLQIQSLYASLSRSPSSQIDL